MGKTYQGGGGWQKQGKRTTVESPPTYSAPTVGLTKVLFTFGSTNDAAELLATKSKLARHFGTQSWPGASMASSAIEDMTNPMMTLLISHQTKCVENRARWFGGNSG